MRVVLSGYFGYGNTGDEAILAGMRATFASLDPELELVVLSGHPDATRRTHGVAAIPRAAPGAVWRALRAADGLISGGGSLLQDVSSARPVAYYAGVMEAAGLARRPYAIHAQGLGPLGRGLNRRLARRALTKAAHVSLRDSDSVKLAREIGVRRAIEPAPDAALALRPSAEPAGHILVAVRAWGGGRTLEPLRTALASLAADLPIVALPMQDAVDREPSQAVVAGIPGARVVGPAATFDDRLAAIASARVVIGMRLHSLILAAASAVPAVAITYDPKVASWADLAGQPVAGDVSEPLDPSRIVGATRDALEMDLGPYRARVDVLRDDVPRSAEATITALRAAAR